MTETPEAIRRKVRGMAILTVVLGIVLALVGVLTIGSLLLFNFLKGLHGGVQDQVPPFFEAILAFAFHSSLITFPLGLILAIGGVVGLSRSPRNLWAMNLSAWICLVAMIALCALFSFEAVTAGLPLGLHLAGAALHGLQAMIVLKAALYLRKPEVKAAMSQAFSPAERAQRPKAAK